MDAAGCFPAVHKNIDGSIAVDDEGNEIYYPLRPGATVCKDFVSTGRCPGYSKSCGEMTCAFDHPSPAEIRRRNEAMLKPQSPKREVVPVDKELVARERQQLAEAKEEEQAQLKEAKELDEQRRLAMTTSRYEERQEAKRAEAAQKDEKAEQKKAEADEQRILDEEAQRQAWEWKKQEFERGLESRQAEAKKGREDWAKPDKPVCGAWLKHGKCPHLEPGGSGRCAFDHPDDICLWSPQERSRRLKVGSNLNTNEVYVKPVEPTPPPPAAPAPQPVPTRRTVFELHQACEHAGTIEELTERLREAPDDLRVRDLDNDLPVHKLARSTSLQVMDMFGALLATYPEALLETGNHRMLPIHVAARHSPSTRLVAELAAQHPQTLQTAVAGGELPIHCAIHNVHGNGPHIVKILAEACPAALKPAGLVGTALHTAALHSSAVFSVDCLIQNCPATCQIENVHQRLPLHLALENKGPEQAAIICSILEAFPKALQVDRALQQRVMRRMAAFKSTESTERLSILLAKHCKV